MNGDAGHTIEDFEDIPPQDPTLQSTAASESLTALLALLDDYGFGYTEEPGYTHRNPTYLWYDGAPFGIMVHHTATAGYAPRAAYPAPEGLRGDGATICNLLIQPDGTINFVSTDPANYSSGLNQKALLDDYVTPGIRFHGPQSGPLGPEWYGNRAWINVEVVNAGNGAPIAPVQEEALIAVCAFMCALKGWDATAVVAHSDGRGTKQDPRWTGEYGQPPYSIAGIQDAVQALLDNDQPPGGTMNYRGVKNVPDEDWARNVVDWGLETGVILIDTNPDWNRTDYSDGRLWSLLNRFAMSLDT